MNFQFPISPRAAALQPSATLKIDAKAKALKKAGADIVNFGVGEPDFDTPEPVAAAGIESIRTGKHRYTPAGGIPELRAAIAEKFRRENGLAYSAEEVIACTGTKQALHDAFQVLLAPGDEVLVPGPYWVSYTELIKLSDGKPLVVPGSGEGRPDIAALRKACTPHTKGILLNSPNNPTGCVYTRAEIEALAKLAVEKNLWILSDEVYEKLVFGNAKHYSPAQLGPEIKDRTVIVNAVSKSFAMTGWRLGFLAGPKAVVAAAEAIQSHATGNPSNPAQYAALAALQGDDSAVRKMVVEYDKRRAAVVKLLNQVPGFECPTPEGAFYAFPFVSPVFAKKWNGAAIGGSMRLAELLLEEAKVALVPGSAFGAEGHLRISYATSMDQIEKGVKRIGDFVRSLT